MAARRGTSGQQAMRAVEQAALALPGAWLDHPWGETVFKAANKKIFVFTSLRDGVFRCTCKLPHSGEAALTMFGFCAPTGYGLGASGWVTAAFPAGEEIPLPMLLEWIGESFAAVAGVKAGAKMKSAQRQSWQRAVERRAAAKAAEKNSANQKSAAAGEKAPRARPAKKRAPSRG